MKNSKLVWTIGLGLVLLAGILLWLQFNSQKRDEPSEIVFRLESFALNLYPPTMAEINSRRIATLLHEPLVRLDEGKITSGVAEAWSHEGTRWRFTVSGNKRFSDGQPVAPGDVSASLCRSMQAGTSWAWSLASIKHTKVGEQTNCDGISVVGDEVLIDQDYDAPWLVEALSGPAGWILPASADDSKPYGEVPGAGRYILESVSPDAFVLLTPAQEGTILPKIRFRYVPDDGQAAALLREGQLSFLYLQTPQLRQAVATQRASSLRVESRDFDRIRILILNEKRLRSLGLTDVQFKTFRDALDSSIDRTRLEQVSEGLAVGDGRVLPVFGERERSRPPADALTALPQIGLTVLSEPDSFSDQLASALPRQVGPIQLRYQAIEKGLLLNSLVSGDFDVVSIVLEATMHSPKFWTSFFEPDGAFVVFGKPIPELEGLDLLSENAIGRLEEVLARESNWVQLVREKRYDAWQPWVADIRFNPAGQDDLSGVRLVKPGASP